MPQQLALFVCVLFILLLFARDRHLRPMTSGALWLVLLWIAIIGSRPVSIWLGGGFHVENPADYLEGSPLDRNVFLIFIVLGLIVLFRRRVDWNSFFLSNRWFLAFFVYCGISCLWSDYPFVSFKRWIKDIGNIVMLLIILTESEPFQATKAVFLRYASCAIPLSVLFIKYFPELGRYYNRWTWEPAFRGITTNKNELGCIVFVCGLFLVWDLIEARTDSGKKMDNADLISRIFLLMMVFWLLSIAGSATALISLILGAAFLLFMQLPFAKKQIRYLGSYSLAIAFFIILLYVIPGIDEAFLKLMGRDATFTGRTAIWEDLLKEPINPLVGTGYQSFWLGDGAQRIWDKYYFHPTQAHNGYIETYLNVGVIGVFLLIALIVSTAIKLKQETLLGSSFGMLRFSFLVLAVIYNWTEAMFGGLNLIWFILLIAVLNYSRSNVSDNMARTVK